MITPITLVTQRPGNAGTVGHAHARAVAAGDERESPVVDIQQCALGPFEQYSFARLHGIQQKDCRVGHVRLQPLGIAGVFLYHAAGIQAEIFGMAIQTGQRPLLGLDDVLDPLRKIIAIQVAQPHGVAAPTLSP